MAQKGKYYELFSTQARRYIESADAINDDAAPEYNYGEPSEYGEHMPRFHHGDFDGERHMRGDGFPHDRFNGERPPMHRPPRRDRED